MPAAIFDRGFRDIEARASMTARCCSTPTARRRKRTTIYSVGSPPGLDWAGTRLAEAKRRAAAEECKQAARLPGNTEGLARHIAAVARLGPSASHSAQGRMCRTLRSGRAMPRSSAGHPGTLQAAPMAVAGKGPAGFRTQCYGARTILKRSRWDQPRRPARRGSTSPGNPLTDPFNMAANRFSIFLPARHRLARAAGATRPIVAEHRPADSLPIIVPVHARMRTQRTGQHRL